jgi:hypothetical protein
VRNPCPPLPRIRRHSPPYECFTVADQLRQMMPHPTNGTIRSLTPSPPHGELPRGLSMPCRSLPVPRLRGNRAAAIPLTGPGNRRSNHSGYWGAFPLPTICPVSAMIPITDLRALRSRGIAPTSRKKELLPSHQAFGVHSSCCRPLPSSATPYFIRQHAHRRGYCRVTNPGLPCLSAPNVAVKRSSRDYSLPPSSFPLPPSP